MTVQSCSVASGRLPLQDWLFDLIEDGGGVMVIFTGTAMRRLTPNAYVVLRDAFANAVIAVRHVTDCSLLRLRQRCADGEGAPQGTRTPRASSFFKEKLVNSFVECMHLANQMCHVATVQSALFLLVTFQCSLLHSV